MRTIGILWRASTVKKILLEHLVEHIRKKSQDMQGISVAY
jgi:hypothetical protein